MTGRKLTLWNCPKIMLTSSLGIIVLLSLTHMCVTSAQHHQSSSWQKKRMEPDFLSEVTRTVRKTLENLIGKENFLMLNENISSLLWLVSSGISSAFLVVARIAEQFLTSFGMAGDELTQFLKLSPDKVQTLLLWSLAALISYWVLSLLLSLLLAILSRIMWGLKFVLFGSCFAFIVFTVPDCSVQVGLLLALLTLYVLLGWLSGSNRSGARLEAKVHSLERQVEELQRRQRQSPRHLDEE
ncbi:transmembrane protein 109 [Python bivittatus]|uniref:Transmembrane protein 109 n=1 Tax=Python bivittatus TaxID=176946 RepID=A0A9F2QZD0_PYTBI|nr:transmembrane protein 109 [Python bivittatus]